MSEEAASHPRRIESDVEWSRLIHHPENPRKGDVGLIAELIRVNGWHGVITAQESTGYILIGNHRARAARDRLDFPTCPNVEWLDVDDEEALRIMLGDNRAGDMAYYNDEALAKVLAGLADTDEGFAGTGFDQGAYELVLQNLAASEETGTHGEVDDAPTPGERAAEWEATDIRSIILPFAGEDYERVLDALISLRNRWGLDTNAQVVLQLVLDAEAAAA
jgi:hypothetical protein